MGPQPRDLAILTLQLLDRLEVVTSSLVGLGFGGFLAAEMATMAPRSDRLVLVGARRASSPATARSRTRSCGLRRVRGGRVPRPGAFRALFDATTCPTTSTSCGTSPTR